MGSKWRKAKVALGMNLCLYVPRKREDEEHCLSPPSSSSIDTAERLSDAALLSPTHWAVTSSRPNTPTPSSHGLKLSKSASKSSKVCSLLCSLIFIFIFLIKLLLVSFLRLLYFFFLFLFVGYVYFELCFVWKLRKSSSGYFQFLTLLFSFVCSSGVLSLGDVKYAISISAQLNQVAG